jgi:hypothetical protein
MSYAKKYVFDTNVMASNIIIRDSTFFREMDDIMGIISDEIKEFDANVCNVRSKRCEISDSVYRLTFALDNLIQIYPEEEFKGYFNYNGFLFLWFGDIPDKLLFISSEKRKIKYTKGIIIAADFVDFVLEYSNKRFIFKELHCY